MHLGNRKGYKVANILPYNPPVIRGVATSCRASGAGTATARSIRAGSGSRSPTHPPSGSSRPPMRWRTRCSARAGRMSGGFRCLPVARRPAPRRPHRRRSPLRPGRPSATWFAGKNSGMSFDPYAPYGAMLETTCRVPTWNVWGRYGEWSARLDGIIAELKRSAPDIVCLEEAWMTPEETEGDLVGEALGLSHRFTWGDWPQDGWISGVAICSRWPIVTQERRPLTGKPPRRITPCTQRLLVRAASSSCSS